MLPATFEFKLPKGWMAPQGQIHRTGEMRLATAIDKIEVQWDVRSQQNPPYSMLIMLARVIPNSATKLASPPNSSKACSPPILSICENFRICNEQ